MSDDDYPVLTTILRRGRANAAPTPPPGLSVDQQAELEQRIGAAVQNDIEARITALLQEQLDEKLETLIAQTLAGLAPHIASQVRELVAASVAQALVPDKTSATRPEATSLNH